MVLLSEGDASLFNLFKVDLWAASFSDFDAFLLDGWMDEWMDGFSSFGVAVGH